ncbi:beta-ketoacyl synthase N-terminal-like domain-containing protein [Paraburkholderia humisilvae]|uniref:Polyketide biosynthesis malonyl-ACP decarboxylase PksF n=1 Tax=Paraburkholderia humisilvae TaxID=627669 RepID=A0A6J5EL99_9BURK|nr:beta-ketoacyl synthase N-terminal-like domain-containing protein [Paraburkholderia humisilvae]CAB3765795.1 Polyketide biosynthesis malonyl-ACP decarboxylase PksF [Paraburkholderia humisilvae]
MGSTERPGPLLISGIGVVSAIGQGQAAFTDALLHGRHRFGVMRRPGRQMPEGACATPFLGAEIDEPALSCTIEPRLLRTASLSGRAALAALDEAWRDACLFDIDPDRIALVIGGSNFQQRELTLLHDAYRDRVPFLRPSYAVSFMDSDVCGLCSAAFGIHGVTRTVGGASASGQLAVIEAIETVRAGRADVCIAIGALMDLGYWECQGFRATGAMGSYHYAHEPERACRPFDEDRDGFIFGEACGAIVVERDGAAPRAGVTPYARLAGWAVRIDGNRDPNPSLDGEVSAIRGALACAGLHPGEIDYVNPHGTGSALGDMVELQALRVCGLGGAHLNTTKSVTGHGLTAAGAIELIAVLVQMRAAQLHPSLNLERPMDADFNWVRDSSRPHEIRHALNLSMGFGGINTAVCVSNY